MKKTVTILGSTGSIGTQAIEVCRHLGYTVAALTADKNITLLEQQAREFSPRYVVITDKNAFDTLKLRLGDTSTKVLYGMDGLCHVAAMEENDIVLNSLVGMVGLRPTLSALRAGKDVALANKETLVAGGKLVMDTAKKHNVQLLPVDSEHCAIFQCLRGNDSKQVERILLTASGGPFFGYDKQALCKVTKAEALRHPNWTMGAKITIDSSTLMNKGLELIEAMWLFSMPWDKIEILVHRQSIVHSMVEYVDHSVIAQLGGADMHIPIQYALTYPQRMEGISQPLDFTALQPLTFAKADMDTFTCLGAAVEAAKQGGLAPCIVNGANEEAVALFLKDEISYMDIMEGVQNALTHLPAGEYSHVDEVLAADKAAKEYIRQYFHK